jgi:hypothetical protein
MPCGEAKGHHNCQDNRAIVNAGLFSRGQFTTEFDCVEPIEPKSRHVDFCRLEV